MSESWRTARWLQRHRTVAWLLHRVPFTRDWISRRVWRELETDPAFVAAIEAGRAEIAAGRVSKWEDVKGRLYE